MEMGKKQIYHWTTFLFVAVVEFSCGTSDQERSPSPATGGPSSPIPAAEESECTTELKVANVTEPTYLGSGQIKDLLISRCIWCHSSSAPSSDRIQPYLTDLDLIRSQGNKIIQEIETGKMPPPQERMTLAANEIEQVRTWIQDGFQEGTSPSWSTTKALSYKEIEPLISARCLPCHDTVINQAPLLSTQAQVEAHHAQIAAAIKADSMPPGAPFSTDERAVIQNWSTGLSANPADSGDPQCP